ncbi:GGDEF and EAL domain-containing protein [Aestuariispira insulae]|uniref:GGDEF and EAL domain-containing protein n=1 Tax=Aestuariispira insulae TaxID=1461337 RepID=UPI0011C07042|nr:GGDEF and EAL domain-containing protein [Aestuariispira insulae]
MTSKDHLSRMALLAAGDVAYCWDLVSDEISWVGDVSSLFTSDGEPEVSDGEAFIARINEEDLAARLKLLDIPESEGGRYECEYRLRQDDAAFAWVHERGQVESDDNGQPLSVAGVMRIVTERKQKERMLSHQTNYDELTGHLNKSRLRDALHNALNYGKRFQVPNAYLLVGLNGLADVHHDLGRDAVDALILGAGQIIERALRSIDTIGRVDTDRFGAVLSNCDEAGLNGLLARLVDSFSRERVYYGDRSLSFSAAIGAVQFPEDVHTATEIMGRAETALMESRAQGVNKASIYRPSEEERYKLRNKILVAQQIEEALRDDMVCFAFQPIVSSSSRKPAYYETLIRIKDSGGELVPAATFIPVAERFGLIRDLDRWGLGAAIKMLEDDPQLRLSINLSALTVTDFSWFRALRNHLRGNETLAKRLMLEITETVAMEDLDVTAHFVASVRQLGCKVALDDFGSGHTSFRQLRSLTVDVVKIDGIFVQDLDKVPESISFVRKLVSISDEIGFETVAEGVEREETAGLLAEQGVHFLQGWHFGKPKLTLDD